MPYEGERASKASHSDIVRNPDVATFLDECNYLSVPSDEDGEKLASRFTEPPAHKDDLPAQVIAFDGSYHESQIDQRLPSTRIGFVKVSAILIELEMFRSLRTDDKRFVDPFKVAALQKNNQPLTFSVPSSNIKWRNRSSVRDSFRAAVDDQLLSKRTRFIEGDYKTSLRSTLFHLAALRPAPLGTGDPGTLLIHRCPNCGVPEIEVKDVETPQFCKHCGGEVFPSDVLRIWEEISEFQSNVQAMTRLMMSIEHLLPVHYTRYLFSTSPSILGSLAFFIDGPLAVFGNSAWLHAAMMRFFSGVNESLVKKGFGNLFLIGLSKTGQVVDHLKLIDRYLPSNRIFCVDDEYRYNYIIASREPAGNGFGYETYYGQDFLYKTPSGRIFTFGLLYPFASKSGVGDFITEKAKLENYPDLPRALALINNFETDLYENAVVPIALAHRYTSISLQPGGRVLDILSKKALA